MYICHTETVKMAVKRCLDVLAYVIYLPFYLEVHPIIIICFICEDLICMQCVMVVLVFLVTHIACDSLCLVTAR